MFSLQGLLALTLQAPRTFTNAKSRKGQRWLMRTQVNTRHHDCKDFGREPGRVPMVEQAVGGLLRSSQWVITAETVKFCRTSGVSGSGRFGQNSALRIGARNSWIHPRKTPLWNLHHVCLQLTSVVKFSGSSRQWIKQHGGIVASRVL